MMHKNRNIYQKQPYSNINYEDQYQGGRDRRANSGISKPIALKLCHIDNLLNEIIC